MGPSARIAVTIPGRVILARRRYAIVGELLRDVPQASAIGICAVDPLDDRSGHRIGFEAVKALAKIRFCRVRVRASVDEPVTIRWSTTEISGRVLRESGHRRTDAHLDSCTLALAHPAEKRHHQVVRFGAGINRAADLRHP
ncbi:hypothetical protein AWC31_07945 [Mycolicibacterium wolinskyi]|uniref:Uncharacterized protein n=1 Tax=Mycolicibacterium wolinskyi TaxID=59750 RepID=A0A1X2EV99_9MYCO|nr:hypothetical protein AWC31_07945 [Mycolicibacterium wolinskyi]